MSVSESPFDRLFDLVRRASRIVAFSGAGVSTESGLADFRSPGGLWERYRVIEYQEFLASQKARREYWSMRRELIAELLEARPNPGHFALAELEHQNRLAAVITQNIDGLHQLAGSRTVIELHGSNRSASCLECSRSWPIETIQERLLGGDLDPCCQTCKGIIKPDTVSFGQPMPQEALDRAFAEAGRCDLFLMLGSSLQVQPAASIPVVAHREGAPLVFINRTATPLDDLAALRFRDSPGSVLPRVVAALAAG